MDLKNEIAIAIQKYHSISTTTLLEISGIVDRKVKEECISFGAWYSGMDRSKVGHAYKRYKREVTN